jgi:hypothetical protein
MPNTKKTTTRVKSRTMSRHSRRCHQARQRQVVARARAAPAASPLSLGTTRTLPKSRCVGPRVFLLRDYPLPSQRRPKNQHRSVLVALLMGQDDRSENERTRVGDFSLRYFVVCSAGLSFYAPYGYLIPLAYCCQVSELHMSGY